ncbi:LOW QUALITY PROTEIN: Hypothetical protein PHPALM_901 [Phytophthora palmivora]|uniref:Uncharacterized protein n=1 Tax=Phytophthora palmivora TaxID=4796 RepID=A0A2P4YTP7_9STRA|nr:LOW QUALITY PROTEIN: Hypothetical protein PHPALM_901 [Phytophthora palmivora]
MNSHSRYNPGVNASHAIFLRKIHKPCGKHQPASARLLRLAFESIDLSQPCYQLLWGGLQRVHAYILQLWAIQFFDHDERPVSLKKEYIVSNTLKVQKNKFGGVKKRFHYMSKDKLLCPPLSGFSKLLPRLEGARIGTETWGNNVSIVIKKAAVRITYDLARFSIRSVRMGGVSALLNSSADRILSNAFEAVLSLKGSVDLARKMY